MLGFYLGMLFVYSLIGATLLVHHHAKCGDAFVVAACIMYGTIILGGIAVGGNYNCKHMESVKNDR